MKLKFSLAILFSVMGITTAEAVDVRLEPILNTEVIRCGSDLSVKSFAYQEDGEWKGFDADLCLLTADTLALDTVIAKGRCMVLHGKQKVFGTFEAAGA